MAQNLMDFSFGTLLLLDFIFSNGKIILSIKKPYFYSLIIDAN
jgi:hypothetical protein